MEHGSCSHGNSVGRCWHCLNPDQQRYSRSIWQKVADDPLFTEAMAHADDDLKEGKVIKVMRSEAGDKEIYFTQSSFRILIDILMEAEPSNRE